MRLSKLFLLLVISSCASIASPKIPRLQDRTLLISREGAYLEYPYFKTVCKFPNRPIFKGCSQVRVVEKFDLNDVKVREQLINMGFVLQSKMRFVY